MRHIRLMLRMLILFLGYGLTGLQAQESLNAAGGKAEGSAGSLTYSVGQMVYTTHTGTNGSVAQGVQQPYEISLITGVEEAESIRLNVSAYPNPTTDYLTLEIEELNISGLSYQLYIMNGQCLQEASVKAQQTNIDMGALEPATYFVSIIKAKKVIKTFKIVKN